MSVNNTKLIEWVTCKLVVVFGPRVFFVMDTGDVLRCDWWMILHHGLTCQGSMSGVSLLKSRGFAFLCYVYFVTLIFVFVFLSLFFVKGFD